MNLIKSYGSWKVEEDNNRNQQLIDTDIAYNRTLKQLPREPRRSTRRLQLTGNLEHNGMLRFALFSAKSNYVHFLNQAAISRSSSNPIALKRLGGPCSWPNPILHSNE